MRFLNKIVKNGQLNSRNLSEEKKLTLSTNIRLLSLQKSEQKKNILNLENGKMLSIFPIAVPIKTTKNLNLLLSRTGFNANCLLQKTK